MRRSDRSALLDRHSRLRPAPRRPRATPSSRCSPRTSTTGSWSWSTTARPTRRSATCCARTPPRRPADPGRRAGRPTATSWPRPTTASRPRAGEFIVLLDHDDLLVPDALSRNAEAIARPRRRRLPLLRRGQGRRRRPPLRRVPQARLVARAAARPDVHLATCRCCAPRSCERRRLPRGLRRLAGPRPRPAGHRAWPAGSCTSPRCSTTGGSSPAPPPATPTPSRTPPIAGRKAVQDHLDRLRHRRRGRDRPATRPLRHPARPRPGAQGQHRSSRRSGNERPGLGPRRVFVVEAVRSLLDAHRARQPRGRRRLRRAHAGRRARPSCARSPATGWSLVPSTSRSTTAAR